MDNPTHYLPCIHGISTLNPAVIHTYTVQEHPNFSSFEKGKGEKNSYRRRQNLYPHLSMAELKS